MMSLDNNIQRLKEEIYYMSEGFGSICSALEFAKRSKINLKFNIPDNIWDDLKFDIEEDIAKYRFD